MNYEMLEACAVFAWLSFPFILAVVDVVKGGR